MYLIFSHAYILHLSSKITLILVDVYIGMASFQVKKLSFFFSFFFQDLVVGYMGVPKYSGISMTQHPQYVTVR